MSNDKEKIITPQTDFYTLEHIENVWDIGIRFLREKIKDGTLPAKTVGKKYMVLHSDLLEFVKSRNDAK
jgi:hypothetical protein